MFGTTATAYDVRFRFLNIPVRIHPLFWLMTAAMGWQPNNLPFVGLWIVCVLISILVHEYGHGLMARRFGESPSILLYGLGGLCFARAERTPAQRLAVLFAGPGAGFLFLAIIVAAMSLVYKISPAEHLAIIRSHFGLSVDREALGGLSDKIPSPWIFLCYNFLVWINLIWGLVNLLPIYPLDGGQATQVVMTQVDPRNGARRSHIVSLVTAGFLAVAAFAYNRDDYFLPMFFIIFAILNFQMLQSYHLAHSYGLDPNDENWRH
jgi:stage IV sporulation protein FB